MTSAAPGAPIARATVDAKGWLIEADEPLAELQRRCGGDLPGAIAIPELRELLDKSRQYRLKLARMIEAFDGTEIIRAWVEVGPEGDDGESGFAIEVANWKTASPADEDNAAETEDALAFDRQFSEITARLDAKQNLLAVHGNSAEVAEQAKRMRAAIGRHWTETLEFPGVAHEQPLHWRLLDKAICRFEGSPRDWRVRLVPLGQPEAGSNGFELHLVAETRGPPPQAGEQEKPPEPLIGPALAPALRQPIARIIANAETIRSQLAGPLSEDYSNYAADIADAGKHLLGLLDDLSDLEIIESEGFEPAPDRIDLADVAHRAAGILAMRASEKKIALALPKKGQSAPAVGEFRRVMQVLLNLLGNAIRYSPEKSTIAISLAGDGDEASITVADEGPGLSSEQQDAAFAKFERLGRSGDGGSGLGLYISRRLARAMGGELSVDSEPGKGARFTLTLPRDAS